MSTMRLPPVRVLFSVGACALAVAAAAFALLLGAGVAEAHDEGSSGHVHLVETGSFGCSEGCPHLPAGYAEPGPGIGEITVHWTPATTGPAAVEWDASLFVPGNPFPSLQGRLAGSARSLTFTGREPGAPYHIRVRGNGPILGQYGREAGADNVVALETLVGEGATVRAGARVTLGRKKAPRTLTYAWTQTAGPTVTLDDATSPTPTFIAPSVSRSTALTFSLTVRDGTSVFTDTETVTVLPTRVRRATVDGDELVVTFDTALDATSKPAGSAFTVTATKSGSSRTIAGTAASVAISGATVTATLSAAAAADERLTVRYDKPASGAVLKDSGGDALPSIPDRPAGNISAGDTTGPRFVSAQANGNKVVYTFDEALEEGVTPEADRFFWRIDGVNVPSGIAASISGRTVTATFDRAVKHGQVVRVWAHRAIEDDANNITDLSGNLAARVINRPADNVTPPAYSSAVVNGDELTVTFDGGLDGTSVPAASAFTVKSTLAGTQRDVALAATNPVSVSGATAVLTLAETLQRVETVTVAYAAPATGKLRDADKRKLPVPDFAAKTAANNSPADTTKPRFVSTQANGATLTVTFDELLDASVTPAVGVFSRILGNDFTGAVRSSGISISGKTVTVTFPTSAGHGNRVRVAHTGAANAANALKDLAGNLVPASVIAFDDNVPNVTPPAYSSASVNGASLTITFDGALDETSVPAASAFTVKATRGGTERDVALAASGAVDVDGATVVLTLAEAVLPAAVDTAVTVAYAAPATGKLQDSDNEKLAVTGFDDTKTATNATPADTTGPAFVSAQANGTTVTVTFDELLDESVTPAVNRFQRSVGGADTVSSNVSIDGRIVTATFATSVGHGASVTLAYGLATNASERLKDLAGNDAPAFSNQSVTNVTPPAYQSASVNGDELTITFDGGLDETSVPAASAFTVKATRGGTERDVALAASGAVTVDDATAVLTLAEAVLAIDTTVTVAYAAPATGKLRDADNLKLAVTGFDDTKTVTNATPADTTRPSFVSAQANGNTVVYTFDEELDESVTPKADRFIMRIGGPGSPAPQATSASISGRTVTATFATAAGHDDGVRVWYQLAVDTARRLTDLSGNEVRRVDNVSATNVTPPAVSSASVNGSSLTITFDGGLDGMSVPAASAFTVKSTLAGTQRDVALAATGAVSVSGATVTLTLAETLLPVETVTVAYAAPATGAKLEDAERRTGPVADFPARAVTNNSPADTTAPSFVSTQANGRTLTVTFDELLDASVTLPVGIFERVLGDDVAGAARSTGVSISGKTVTATFATSAGHGTRVRAIHRGPGVSGDVNALKDLAGNRVPVSTEAFNDNVPNVTPPAYSSASVDGDELTVTFDGGLDETSVPAASAFTVKATRAGTERNVALAATGAVDVDGATVALRLAEAVLAIDTTVTVAYTAPATGKLQDADNLKLPVTGFDVTKTATNATPADTTAPTSSESMNGAVLTLAFDEALDESSVPDTSKICVTRPGGTCTASTRITVSGATVTATFAFTVAHGEALQMVYHPGGANRIKDLSGNEATSFVNRRLTNVTPPAYSSASVDGDELTVTFDGGLDETSVPAASAFTVKATRGTTERDVPLAASGAVEVDGATVALTLAEEVLRIDTVTVAYAAPPTGKLQDADQEKRKHPAGTVCAIS